MTALLTGGTGLLGRALAKKLNGVTVLTRNPAAHTAQGALTFAHWDPEKGIVPTESLKGHDTVFHLAGEPVAEGRWTTDKKRRIRDSRVLGTRHLVQGLSQLETKPKVLVSASAVGFYGDRNDEILDESSRVGDGFLADVCAEWEREALQAQRHGIRVVTVRIGIVLSPEGGALGRMLPPFKLGAGGPLGGGQQWMPWIHLNDVVGIFLHAAKSEEVQGAMNAVSPEPVTNAAFTQALGKTLHRPAFFPVPKLALRLAFGEMGGVLTSSQRALPTVAQRTGYTFEFAQLQTALADLLSRTEAKVAA